MNTKKIIYTCFIYLIFFTGMLIVALGGPLAYLNTYCSSYLSFFSNYYGFNQFIYSLPRRIVFGVYGMIFFYFWMKIENIEFPKKTNIKATIVQYAQGFFICFSFYFLSEFYYWAAGYSQLLSFDPLLLIKSSFFFLISSGMGSILEEVCFRHILLESFEKNSSSFTIANVLQSLLFTLCHLLNPGVNFLRICSWFFFALFLGLLKKTTKSIAIPIGFHSGFHYGSILNKLTSKTNVYFNNGTFMFQACFIMALLGVYLYDKKISQKICPKIIKQTE